jgi:type IV pilus assembly protein PilO
MSRDKLIQTLWEENRGKMVTVLVLLLLIFSTHFVRVLWFDQKVEASLVQLRKAQDDLRITQQRIEEGGGEKISGISDDLEQFYKIIPSRSGLGNFIGRLYTYADDAGIDIAQISYLAKPVEDTSLLSYKLNFGVSGSYLQLKKFIHLLENSPSVLILDKISLSSSQQETTEIVSLRMELKTFFREDL